MFEREYDRVSEEYDHHYTDPECLQENEELKQMLADLIKPDDYVLDIGCGTGFLLDIYPISPERYIGIDPSQSMLEVMQRKYPEHRTDVCTFEECGIDPSGAVVVAIFSGQYISPDEYEYLAQQDKYLYIFYKPDHYPDWIYGDAEHQKLLDNLDYEELHRIFNLQEWHNYLIAYKT